MNSWVQTIERESTRASYQSATRRFVAWLIKRDGPDAGAPDITLEALAKYQRGLLASGRSPFTVRKDRAAINTWIAWLAEHELIDQAQARLALSVQRPRPREEDARRPIVAMSDGEYDLLLREAERELARDELIGWRDIAIVRVLGECGLRAEELLRVERRDVRPARKGAIKRELFVRHGKGARQRAVPLANVTLNAIRRWDRGRIKISKSLVDAVERERWPLFCAIGAKRRDGSYTAFGRRASYDLVAELIERLATRAELAVELRHPHVLRHTYATRYYRQTRDMAGLQELLGHADIRTTRRYAHVSASDLGERVSATFDRRRIALNDDG